MRGNPHVRFGGRAGETDQPKGRHRASVRSNHTGNTLAASSGASLRELMAHMGHSSPRAALIYQHATKRGERAIGDFLGGLIERRTNGGGGTRSGTPTEPDGARGGHAGS
jgi:hypothetical protein